MQALRSSCNAIVARLLQPRFTVLLWGQSCDPQSACARAARDIFLLVDRKKNTPDQDERIKEEILQLLDHDRLLTDHHCHALAVLTLHEALRLSLRSKLSEDKLLYLEGILAWVKERYSTEPRNKDPEDAPHLHVLVPRHLGHGVQYLKALWKQRNEPP